jgi:hypothetical protein
VVPASGDAETVAFVRELLGGAPPDPGGDPLVGTRDEAGSLIVSDLLLGLDAARAFAAAAPFSGEEPWLTGVLVQLALRYAWERAEPGATLGYVAAFDRMAAAHGGPRAARLADYRDGLPFERDLWYQAQFVRGADAIWIHAGARGTKSLLASLAKKGVPAGRAALEAKYPELVDWERSAFAP